jgi:lipopolysaccharide transport system ATP-binding protein
MFRVNVQNVDKEYRLYAKPHDRLWEALFRKPKHNLFKVLSDISFNIGLGQSLGIIGDNGAGKSTLLKLLAGTIHPTMGNIEVNGRVAALLELGAGFHPEFTGRQNIHLNASLLGIPKEEIKLKEHEIIEFAELEQFIDQPVRTYSSGMYVRLAFSIATTVDPEILIIDEALAVGDMAFQKKCITRMNLFKEQGKTMLFCSHSMYHVQELCDQVIWLENGKIKKAGKCSEIVGLYEDFCNQKKVVGENVNEQHDLREAHEKDCRILSFSLKSIEGNDIKGLTNPKLPIIMEMEIEVMADNINPNFGFAITSNEEEILGASLTNYEGLAFGPYFIGHTIVVRYMLDFFPLRVGTFILVGAVSDDTGLLWYDSKTIGPVTVPIEKGVGRVSLKGSWEVIE